MYGLYKLQYRSLIMPHYFAQDFHFLQPVTSACIYRFIFNNHTLLSKHKMSSSAYNKACSHRLSYYHILLAPDNQFEQNRLCGIRFAHQKDCVDYSLWNYGSPDGKLRSFYLITLIASIFKGIYTLKYKVSSHDTWLYQLSKCQAMKHLDKTKLLLQWERYMHVSVNLAHLDGWSHSCTLKAFLN